MNVFWQKPIITDDTGLYGSHRKSLYMIEPWKLCGVPGLILKANADNGKYRFEATGIEASNRLFPEKMYGHELSNRMKRKDMLELQ